MLDDIKRVVLRVVHLQFRQYGIAQAQPQYRPTIRAQESLRVRFDISNVDIVT